MNIASQILSASQHSVMTRAASGTNTMACAAYAGFHQRRSMVRPRSIASHGERRRSVIAMSLGCTRASREEEVHSQHRPDGNARPDLQVERDLGERRPERLDERRGEEHYRRAIHDAYRG